MTWDELEKILDDRYGVKGTDVHRCGKYCIDIYRHKTQATVSLLEREEKYDLTVWINNKCVYSKSARDLFTLDLYGLKRDLDKYFPHRNARQEQMEFDDD